jgi:hypothetical protein
LNLIFVTVVFFGLVLLLFKRIMSWAFQNDFPKSQIYIRYYYQILYIRYYYRIYLVDRDPFPDKFGNATGNNGLSTCFLYSSKTLFKPLKLMLSRKASTTRCKHRNGVYNASHNQQRIILFLLKRQSHEKVDKITPCDIDLGPN